MKELKDILNSEDIKTEEKEIKKTYKTKGYAEKKDIEKLKIQNELLFKQSLNQILNISNSIGFGLISEYEFLKLTDYEIQVIVDSLDAFLKNTKIYAKITSSTNSNIVNLLPIVIFVAIPKINLYLEHIKKVKKEKQNNQNEILKIKKQIIENAKIKGIIINSDYEFVEYIEKNTDDINIISYKSIIGN